MMISIKSIIKPQILILTILFTRLTPNHTLLTPTPQTKPPPSPQVKRLLQNLQSISTHIQNPDLYSTSWANNVSLVSSSSPKSSNKKRKSKTTGNENDDYCLIASKYVSKGELLTLYPVHAIGIKHNDDINNKINNGSDENGEKGGMKMGMKMGMGASYKKNTKKKLQKQKIQRNKNTFLESYNYLYHDSRWNFDDTVPAMREYQHEVKIPFALSSLTESTVSSSMLGVHPLLCQYEHELFIQSHPTRKALPGWYGHLIQTKKIATSSSSSFSTKENISLSNNPNSHNCIVVPIPCSIPLCGIVATRDIEKGEQIVRHTYDDDDDSQEEEMKVVMEYVKNIIQRYTAEITELGSYYQMAYDAANQEEQKVQTNHDENDELQSIPSSSSFHTINESYPNLTKLHSNPDIYTIPNFLTSDECDRLVQKASTNLQPCLIKTEDSGQVQLNNHIRTSTNANIPRGEVPTITQKIQNLIQFQSEDQLEIYQVLKYDKGQEFKPHTDGFEKAMTACGFFQSGRIVTLFTYLNDVAEGSGGGQTIFTKLGVKITPKKGMAVIHFPMTLDLVEDKRTEHEGAMAIDEKWILTTWVWKDERLDERYSEDSLQPASDHII